MQEQIIKPKIGKKIKRKNYDFKVVTIIDITPDSIIIDDGDTTHPVSNDKIDIYFEPVE